MKIYQLVAHGNLAVFPHSYRMHSKIVYRTTKQATEAIQKFTKVVTTAKDKRDFMYMDEKNLRVIIVCLELINNKQETKNGNTKKR